MLSLKYEYVREKLIDVAHKRLTIYYQELCNDCGLSLDMYSSPLDRVLIGDILDPIGSFEYQAGRPLITSLVITRSGEEGDGYFKLCERLGLTSDWTRLKKDDTFSIKQISACHDFWADPKNYNDYR